jgi:hypothetical protein
MTKAILQNKIPRFEPIILSFFDTVILPFSLAYIFSPALPLTSGVRSSATSPFLFPSFQEQKTSKFFVHLKFEQLSFFTKFQQELFFFIEKINQNSKISI